MAVDDLRHDRKTQPNTSFLGGHKRIKNFFADRIRDPGTIVSEPHQNSFGIILYRPRYLNSQCAAILLHCLVSILHQVYEGLFTQTFVKRYQR